MFEANDMTYMGSISGSGSGSGDGVGGGVGSLGGGGVAGRGGLAGLPTLSIAQMSRFILSNEVRELCNRQSERISVKSAPSPTS